MKTYCTYCSADKNKTTSFVPAIDLYKSKRISSIFEKSKDDGVKFLILSGKYGIIPPNKEIRYYDHLLLDCEVDDHVNLMIPQLKSLGIQKMTFFMNNLSYDPNLSPYLSCIEKSCFQLGITLQIKMTDLQD